MHRVKKIEYDDDEFYSEDEEGYAEEGGEYTTEDRENFATYTPVVRAEVEEAGLQATDKEIEDALWHYYWDVSKSVAKNSSDPAAEHEERKSQNQVRPSSREERRESR